MCPEEKLSPFQARLLPSSAHSGTNTQIVVADKHGHQGVGKYMLTGQQVTTPVFLKDYTE